MSEAKKPCHGAMLGPQRLAPTITEVLEEMGVDGPLAVITAGWQEREGEDDELRAACGGRDILNLRLYARWEVLMARDPAFASAHRARQDRVRRQQSLYRIRLDYAMRAARKLQEQDAPQSILASEIEDAIHAVQTLDAHHLERLTQMHAEFNADMRPDERPLVATQRGEVHEAIKGSAALVIAGGHVAVLLNRLRLYRPMLGLVNQPIIAWSAGAMVLAKQVVIFHDSPPQGFGHAEVLDRGFGVFPDVLPLPHARRRLHLHDPERVSLFARRFAPASSLTLDERGLIRLHPDGRCVTNSHVRKLHPDGRVLGV